MKRSGRSVSGLSACTSVQVWRKGGGFVPLALYAAQLALNLAWSPIFFKKHQLGFALADVTGENTDSLGLWQHLCSHTCMYVPGAHERSIRSLRYLRRAGLGSLLTAMSLALGCSCRAI